MNPAIFQFLISNGIDQGTNGTQIHTDKHEILLV